MSGTLIRNQAPEQGKRTICIQVTQSGPHELNGNSPSHVLTAPGAFLPINNQHNHQLVASPSPLTRKSTNPLQIPDKFPPGNLTLYSVSGFTDSRSIPHFQHHAIPLHEIQIRHPSAHRLLFRRTARSLCRVRASAGATTCPSGSSDNDVSIAGRRFSAVARVRRRQRSVCSQPRQQRGRTRRQPVNHRRTDLPKFIPPFCPTRNNYRIIGFEQFPFPHLHRGRNGQFPRRQQRRNHPRPS